jgi:DNA-binding response OmpR family regulator
MSRTTSPRVLVIEDDAVVAMLVEEILLDMGLQVLTSPTLDSALVDIEIAAFDAAIVDMHLRGDSASPITRVLLDRKTPFLVLSGLDQSGFTLRHPQIQALLKPFDRAALEAAVHKMLVA